MMMLILLNGSHPSFRRMFLIDRFETPGISVFWSCIWFFCVTTFWFGEDLLVMNAEVSGDSATETTVSFGKFFIG